MKVGAELLTDGGVENCFSCIKHRVNVGNGRMIIHFKVLGTFVAPFLNLLIYEGIMSKNLLYT